MGISKKTRSALKSSFIGVGIYWAYRAFRGIIVLYMMYNNDGNGNANVS